MTAWRAQVDRSWTGAWELPDALARAPSADERLAIVALSMAGFGPGRLAEVLRRSPIEVLAETTPAPSLDSVASRLSMADARAVVPSDAEYPAALREIPAAPPLLFVRGAGLDALQPAVAIVGARVCTPGGVRFARALAGAVAAAGMTVVSGLARGIDGAAHEGALRRGRTAAVLGTGIDIVYPSEHRSLLESVAGSGAAVTEFPPGIRPKAWHFPARNRIISGLCLATIVVEAGERSGALVTAGFALDQGREVLACTVSPTSPSGAGVRQMLLDGARLVVDAEETARELAALAVAQGYVPVPVRSRSKAARPAIDALDRQSARVLGSVVEGTTVDEIVRRTGLSPSVVSSALGMLELDGLVSDDGGGRWRRES